MTRTLEIPAGDAADNTKQLDITEHAHNRTNSEDLTRRRIYSPRNTERIAGLSNLLGDSQKTIEDLEIDVRRNHTTNPLLLTILGNVAAVKVFAFYLVTLDTLIACAFSIGLTCFWYFNYKDSGIWIGSGMDWALLGFAVVTPISASISMAFSRREQALIRITQIRSFSYQLFLAHSLWDLENGGRASHPNVDWLAHSDAVLAQLIGIGDELSRYLSLPTATRSRHRLTSHGRKEASRILRVSYRLLDSLYTRRLTRLSQLAETLRKLGLASGELSRIRQYERFIGEAIEGLRMFKHYRTPLALRSFARLFTLILPPFYAPTFAQLAKDLRSLAVGLTFSVITTLALTALFESIQVLEDSFVAFLTLDGIDVREEFEVLHWQQLIRTRQLLFPNAPPYQQGTRKSLETLKTKAEQLDELRRYNESTHSRTSSYDLTVLLDRKDSMANLDGSNGFSQTKRRPRVYTNEI